MAQLIGYSMMLAFPYALWMFWSIRQQVKTADSWPCAEGEVVTSSIGSSSSGSQMSPNTMYQANIVYQYEVGGRRRENNKICLGGQLQLSLQNKAREYIARYPQGKKVIVHYNPRNPADSVLEVREESSWFYLAAATIVFFVGFYLI